MHDRSRAIVTFSALLLFGQSLHAQTGTADLRYRAPLPASVTYITFDTIKTTMSGTPIGDMTSTTAVRTVSELSFAVVEGGIDVTAVLEELRGSATSPIGETPIIAGDIPPQTIRLATEGPRPEDAAAIPTPSWTGASPGDIMAAAKAMSGLVRLPGRELVTGETWADTLRFRMTPETDGMTIEIVIVTHGTYTGDTIQGGTTLNVLKIRSETTMTMNGTVRGQAMLQQMTTSSEDRVLWDSTQHYVVSRNAEGQSRVEVSMTGQDMTMVTTGRIRSITTAQPES